MAEVQACRHRADDRDDLVRPEESRPELAGGLDLQRSGRTVAKAEPHPVIHGEGHIPMVLVVKALVDRLGLLEPGTHILKKSVPVRHMLCHCCDARLARLVGANRRRITTVDNLEWCLLEGGLEGHVVHVLRPGQPPHPLARLVSREVRTSALCNVHRP